MRLINCITVLTVSVLSSTALAEENFAREKVKTGILPAGGFYSLYEVSCSDNTTASIASMDRRSKWCALSGDELSCYRIADQASSRACASQELAASATPSSLSTTAATP